MSNKTPTISVIVPVYNVEQFLPSCIESILAQSFQDFELILVDDGSTDKSGKLCDQYKETSDKITVIHQENKGVSSARNAGLALAKGKYLSFVDADDSIEKEMYQIMVGMAESDRLDIVACGVKHFDEKGNYLFDSYTTERLCTQPDILECLFDKPDPLGGVIWNKLFLRYPIAEIYFDEDARRTEDVLYLFEVYRKIDTLKKISNTFYCYVERETSISHSGTYMRFYEDFYHRYNLIKKSKQVSKHLESLAIDKFLDYCLRYFFTLKQNMLTEDKSVKEALNKTKKLVYKVLFDAIIHHKLSIQKIHGYVIAFMHF